MWNMSESDRKYYERQKIRDRIKRERMMEREKLMPRRKEVLQMVKDGKITLDEAKAIIRKEEKGRG